VQWDNGYAQVSQKHQITKCDGSSTGFMCKCTNVMKTSHHKNVTAYQASRKNITSIYHNKSNHKSMMIQAKMLEHSTQHVQAIFSTLPLELRCDESATYKGR
jgi:hypothetical protein